MSVLANLSKHQQFKRALAEYRENLYRIAYSWCHNPALADDLVQETLAKAQEEAWPDMFVTRARIHAERHRRLADQLLQRPDEVPMALHAHAQRRTHHGLCHFCASPPQSSLNHTSWTMRLIPGM